MSKNIVILFDGTSNEIKEDRTNILRLYGTLEKNGTQLVYYDPGVGTMGKSNAFSRLYRKGWEIFDLVTGHGLDANVKEAYRFLVENYQVKPKRGGGRERDRIYLIGFSRGAYTARVLAGFIHAFGLVEPRNLNLVDYAFRAYKRIGRLRDDDGFAEIRLFERVIRADRPPIRFLGLFDTVASVLDDSLVWRTYPFTKQNVSVESVRHAVALEERRSLYRPQLWEGRAYRSNPFNSDAEVEQDVKEVWFAGVHGDVGGGYPERKSALAKIPLWWMIEEGKTVGLKFKTATVNEIVLGKRDNSPYVAPDPHAAGNQSMTAFWRILEVLPQRKQPGSRRIDFLGWTIPLAEWRWPETDADIHESVRERYSKRKPPPNLPP